MTLFLIFAILFIERGDIMESGERLREARKKLNLTLEEFGKNLGVKKNAISAIETGKNNLTDQMAKAICREYNINYFWLTKGEGEMFFTGQDALIDELVDEYNLDATDKTILQEYIKLKPQERQVIKQYLLNLSNSLKNETTTE